MLFLNSRNILPFHSEMYNVLIQRDAFQIYIFTAVQQQCFKILWWNVCKSQRNVLMMENKREVKWVLDKRIATSAELRDDHGIEFMT